MFTITAGKGFRMQFENGYRVSVQWGYGNYCDNNARDASKIGTERDQDMFSCPTAEIAIIDEDGNFVKGEEYKITYDDVSGYVGTNEVVRIMSLVSELPKKGEM